MLPSAHSAVLITDKPGRFRKFRHAFFVFGLLVALMGGLDLLSRLPSASLGSDALQTAFEPAAMLNSQP
ncbi:MAG TPA: hypothetical protein VN701_00630 [Candidatus Paceibacterota bacterium]|nr:hypothetical protein [Candidatus Paceibacterota bacterium]